MTLAFVSSNLAIPARKKHAQACFFQLNPPSAEEIHLRWMKSLRDEICLSAGDGGGFSLSEAARLRFHLRRHAEDFIRALLGFHRATHDFIPFRVCRQIRTGESLPPGGRWHAQACFFQLNPPMAEEIHLRWMKSLRDEICLTAGDGGGFNFI